MKSRSINHIALTGMLAVFSITLTQCTQNKTAGWQRTNDELIEKYSLSKKDISGLPKNTTESNLEEGKVKDTQTLDSTQLYSGVSARIFWGTGAMAAVVKLAPNAKIPEETLPADRVLVVLEGSVDQLINGAAVTMLSRKR